MSPAAVARTLPLVEHKPVASNRRYREWMSRYIPLAAKMPDEWAATVAFFPILCTDLCNPALEELAELMRESVPWEGAQLRKRYGRLVRPLLRNARVGLNDWLLLIRDTEMGTVLPVVEAGVVSEVLKRCPQVDRPARKRRPVHKEDRALGLQLLRKMPMGGLAMSLESSSKRRPSMARSICELDTTKGVASGEGREHPVRNHPQSGSKAKATMAPAIHHRLRGQRRHLLGSRSPGRTGKTRAVTLCQPRDSRFPRNRLWP